MEWISLAIATSKGLFHQVESSSHDTFIFTHMFLLVGLLMHDYDTCLVWPIMYGKYYVCHVGYC